VKLVEEYWERLEAGVKREWEIAARLRTVLQNPLGHPEVKLARDMAERVEILVGPPGVAETIRRVSANTPRGKLPFRLVDELHSQARSQDPKRLTAILRAALAVMTPPGTTAAPNEGIVEVRVKENPDGSKYLAVYYAGPIRSAGGTEIAGSVVLADYLRRVAGLGIYRPTDEEVMRFIEEIRTYRRKVGNFQYKVPEEVLEYVLRRLPIEITGIATDLVPVSSYRYLPRVETPYLRGGALRVVNDGVVGRVRKLMLLLEVSGLEGWEWIREVPEMMRRSKSEGRSSVVEEVVGGRPILSLAGRFGGFRLRYGRAPNTSMSGLGVHPYAMRLLRGYVAIGTQLKTDYPGKGGVAMSVSTIEPPVVLLADTSVLRVDSEEKLAEAEERMAKILFNGDILVSFGDCVENNVKLLPPGYCEDYWVEEVLATGRWGERLSHEEIRHLEAAAKNPYENAPPVEVACRISARLGTPLHPRYTPFWDQCTGRELQALREWLRTSLRSAGRGQDSFTLPANRVVKGALESMLIEHRVRENRVQLSRSWVKALIFLLRPFKPIDVSDMPLEKAVEELTGLPFRKKMGMTLTVRVGRPEKAKQRRLKPPVHILFPVGLAGGAKRDLLKASQLGSLSVELALRTCTACGERTWRERCGRCGGLTVLAAECPSCGSEYMDPEERSCSSCGSRLRPFRKWIVDLRSEVEGAMRAAGASVKTVKGVKGLSSWAKTPEQLVKGVLRASLGLYVYKDGTIRFDCTNAPLTHFTPRQIMASPERMRELGYSRDVEGKPLVSEDQLLELKIQDVIIPAPLARHLYKVSRLIDSLLAMSGLEERYGMKSPDDIVGHLVAVLSPHTHGAVACRVIGVTNTRVLYAHPILHAAKRRDCDGDEDSVMLLTDMLMNFSRLYLPDRVGGAMDSPLLLTYRVDPAEVDEQAHNVEVAERYPLEFFRAAEREEPAVKLLDKIPLIKHVVESGTGLGGTGCMPHSAVLQGYVVESSYTKKRTMLERVDAQLELCSMLSSVDPAFVAERLLAHHVLPDILGNLRTYLSQSYICRRCGARYRRILLRGTCRVCGSELSQTVYRGAVEKYIELAHMLLEEYVRDPYLRAGVVNAIENVRSVFRQTGEGSPRQLSLKRYL
jgi:DNA polymerase II large subunit